MAIYDAIGGEPAVDAAVRDFYVRVLADPDLSGYFEGIDMERLKGHQRKFITAALGGPQSYSGRAMGAVHSGLNITGAHFEQVVGHLAATLASLGVDEPTIKTIAESLAPLRAEIAPEG